MKKVLIVFTVLCGSHLLFAQDNTLPATGNVGVGTLNPDSRLQVKGNMKVDSCLIVLDSMRIDKTFRAMDNIFVEGDATMEKDAIVKEDFKVYGNVTIEGDTEMFGDASIDGTLKLTGTEELPDSILTNGNFDFLLLNTSGAAKKASYDTLLFNLKDGIYAPYPPSKCDVNGIFQNPTWASGPNKIYSLCPQVDVGIGTDMPRSTLDVHGITYTSSLAVGVDPADLVGRFHIKTINPNPLARLITVENADRKILTLDNNGLLHAREIKIDADVWPDYVFEKNYELMPLREVQNYIQLNGHLPNIPSAQTVLEEGINLAEMNRLLLEKIEELTLHLIEQERRIEELENR